MWLLTRQKLSDHFVHDFLGGKEIQKQGWQNSGHHFGFRWHAFSYSAEKKNILENLQDDPPDDQHIFRCMSAPKHVQQAHISIIPFVHISIRCYIVKV